MSLISFMHRYFHGLIVAGVLISFLMHSCYVLVIVSVFNLNRNSIAGYLCKKPGTACKGSCVLSDTIRKEASKQTEKSTASGRSEQESTPAVEKHFLGDPVNCFQAIGFHPCDHQHVAIHFIRTYLLTSVFHPPKQRVCLLS